MRLTEHQSVKDYLEKKGAAAENPDRAVLDAAWVRKVVLDAGADDAGIAPIDSPLLEKYRHKILALFPGTRSCISVVCRMNYENVASPFRSQVELEFHQITLDVDGAARRAMFKLAESGVRAMNVGAVYPLNMDKWGDDGSFLVSHKPLALAAGMGHLGLNHLVVHPRFGCHLSLAAILIDREVSEYNRPLEEDRCVKCMMCVTSCPVGALHADGHFNLVACLNHSNRDKLSGFIDWVENLVRSRSPLAYRRRVSDAETVAMWQSLSVGICFKCVNCMAVCPGGEDRVGAYSDDPKAYRDDVPRMLQQKTEPVFVVRGSDAEAHVRKRFPHKPVVYVNNCLRAARVSFLFDFMPNVFQREASKGVDATYHFSFTGDETLERTVTIRNKAVRVEEGRVGRPDLHVFADSRTWLQFLAGECSLVRALATRRMRLKGPIGRLKEFGRCFRG